MPNMAGVLREIQEYPTACDAVRAKYLAKLHRHTGRNVIAYYSGWLQRPASDACDISDLDMTGLVSAAQGLKKDSGLDFVLHTPGGDSEAAKSLADFLHHSFDADIRCFVPQQAMSGGTVIACACKEIHMGKQSSVGPMDPQINGISVHAIINEFEEAIASVRKDPGTLPFWRSVIERYGSGFITYCRDLIENSGQVVEKWLTNGMLLGEEGAEKTAKRIVGHLGSRAGAKIHSRHIHADEAKEFGLKIKLMEEGDLHDLVMSVHYAYMHTFSLTPVAKIIENHLGHTIAFGPTQEPSAK
jgi:hypothetical protein